MAQCKLVLRSGPSLDSHRIGNLLEGKTVLLLRQQSLADGTVRSQVAAKSSPRGVIPIPLGWVTSHKGDDPTFRILEEDEIADADWRLELEDYNHRKDASSMLWQLMSARGRNDSMASRIALQRMQRRLSRWSPRRARAPMPDTGHADTPKMNQFVGVDPQQHEAWDDVSALSQLAAEHWRKALAIEARFFDKFAERIGLVLLSKGLKETDLYQLVTQADVGGDSGALSRVEFRQFVRMLGAPDATHGEHKLMAQAWLSGDDPDVPGCSDQAIDDYFQTIDIDRSSALSAHELVLALLSLKNAAKREAYKDALAKLEGLRETAAAFEHAARAVADHDAGKAAHEGMRRGSVSSRLGELLKQRGVQVNDLRNKWDTDGSGKVDRTEFKQNLLALGFECTAAELDELFAELDADGSGTLQSKELVASLKKLLQRARDQKSLEASFAGAADAARRDADRAQKLALELAATWEARKPYC